MLALFKLLEQTGVQKEFAEKYQSCWNQETVSKLLQFLAEQNVQIQPDELQQFLAPVQEEIHEPTNAASTAAIANTMFAPDHGSWHESGWDEMHPGGMAALQPGVAPTNSLGMAQAEKLLDDGQVQPSAETKKADETSFLAAEEDAWESLEKLAPDENQEFLEDPISGVEKAERSVEHELSSLVQSSTDVDRNSELNFATDQWGNPGLFMFRDRIPEEYQHLDDLEHDLQPGVFSVSKFLQQNEFLYRSEEDIAQGFGVPAESLSASEVLACEFFKLFPQDTTDEILEEPEEEDQGSASMQALEISNEELPAYLQKPELLSESIAFEPSPKIGAELGIDETNEEPMDQDKAQEAEEIEREKAKTFLAQGKFRQAIEIYSQLAQSNPAYLQYIAQIEERLRKFGEYLSNGEVKLREGNLSEAAWHFAQAKEIHPNHFRLQKLLAELEAQKKQSGVEQKKSGDITVVRMPPNPAQSSIEGVGSRTASLRRLSAAEEAFAKSGNPFLDSSRLTAHFDYLQKKLEVAHQYYQEAKELEAKGLYQEALTKLNKCLELVPDIPGGQEYHKSLEKLTQKDPEAERHLKDLGEKCWQECRFPEAISAWCDVLLIHHDPEVEEKIGQAEKRLQEAMELWEKAKVLMNSEKNDEALELIQDCLKIYPYHGSALRTMEQIKQSMPKPSERISIPSPLEVKGHGPEYLAKAMETREIRTKIVHAQKVRRQTQDYNRQVIEQKKQFEERYTRAKQEEQNKNYAQALQMYQELVTQQWFFDISEVNKDIQRLQQMLFQRGSKSTVLKFQKIEEALAWYEIEEAESYLHDKALSQQADALVRERWQVALNRCLKKAQERIWLRYATVLIVGGILVVLQFLGNMYEAHREAWAEYGTLLDQKWAEVKTLNVQYEDAKKLRGKRTPELSSPLSELQENVEKQIALAEYKANVSFKFGLAAPGMEQSSVLVECSKVEKDFQLILQQLLPKVNSQETELAQKLEDADKVSQEIQKGLNDLQIKLKTLLTNPKAKELRTSATHTGNQINSAKKKYQELSTKIKLGLQQGDYENYETWLKDMEEAKKQLQSMKQNLEQTLAKVKSFK